MTEERAYYEGEQVYYRERRRRQIVFSAILGVFGVVLFLIPELLAAYFWMTTPVVTVAVNVLAFLSVGAAIFTLLLSYLRGELFPRRLPSGDKVFIPGEYPSNIDTSYNEAPGYASVAERLDSINRELQDLKKGIGGAQGSSVELTEEEKAALLTSMEGRIEEGLSDEVLRTIEAKYSDSLLEGTRLSELKKDLAPIKDRLNAEIGALGNRNNVNLAFGVITTLAAVGVLGYMVWSRGSQTIDITDTTALSSYYIPRLSLAIFIQVFAFFFLRLYKSGLDEIKYFQNELTNVEMKTVALEAALLLGQVQAIDATILQLVQTERNFILKEGESTVDLEKVKVDNQQTLDAFDTLSKALADLRGLNRP